MYHANINSMLGVISLTEEDGALTELRILPDAAPELEAIPRREAVSPLLAQAEEQLNEYFSHLRRDFDLPLAPKGTVFQRQVWAALEDIPYGETRTYAQIAAAIGRPQAARAVGAACGKNPLWLVIPCHRVIGSSGALTGYAGGLEAKAALLQLESMF